MAYAKHTWQTGETITATKLNNIENGIATNDEAIGDVPEQIDAIQEELESKANVDGVYETMTVGNAEQLVSTQFVEDNAPYVFRTSGGSADIGNREEDTIVGGTVAWNQLVPRSSNFSASGGASVSTTDGVGTFTATASGQSVYKSVSITSGHIYLSIVTYKTTTATSEVVARMHGTNVTGDASTNWQTAYKIWSAVGQTSTIGVRDLRESGWDAIQVKDFQSFDLTQMFGSAVADAVYAMEQANAGSGVAWFKAQYPLDYYAYNTGELKSVEGLASHDMVGFNQWDGQIRSGYFTASGTWTEGAGTLVSSVNPIHVLPNTKYYLRWEGTGNGYITEWTKAVPSGQNPPDGVFIRRLQLSPGSTHKFTTSAQTQYIHFNMGNPYTNEGKDIVINLSWSGTRDGEYEPYVKRSYPLDSTLTLRGIPKVDADGQMYYDGDTYEADGTVTRKYGVVDLGTLTWQLSESTGLFISTAKSSLGVMPNLKNAICYKYTFNGNANNTTTSAMNEALSDKQMCAYSNTTNTNKFIIKDSAYSDATALTTALNGVYLVYELATPTTEQAEPYQAIQAVEDWGTEEYVTTGIVAVGHETKYGSNLRDKLQHLPVLAEDDGAYLIQQTGTQMHLVNFRIPKAEDLADGTYVLKATVSGGTPTYTWEAES